MCSQCNSKHEWEIVLVTVKNSTAEPVNYMDAYYGHVVTIKAGESARMYVRARHS